MTGFIGLHKREKSGEKGERVLINIAHVDAVQECMDERGLYTDIHTITGHGFVVWEDFDKVMRKIGIEQPIFA